MSKAIDDDAFKQAVETIKNEKDVDPNTIQWPACLRWLPGTSITRHTWNGLSAIFCGMCIQSGIGVYNIWGALAAFFTSKYRLSNPNLLLRNTLYVYPLTFVSMTISMQLG